MPSDWDLGRLGSPSAPGAEQTCEWLKMGE